MLVVKAANLPSKRKVSGTIPIVFGSLSDTTALDYVASFARPGGTVTGFASFESTLVGKRLALLRELSPSTLRVLYITSRLVGAGTGDLLARASKGRLGSRRHPNRWLGREPCRDRGRNPAHSLASATAESSLHSTLSPPCIVKR